MSDAFGVRLEWLDAPGVSTPELGSTWARYEIWIGDRCATQVEDSDGMFRRSVYGSLYPLAEWVAANWWVLGHDIRPSAVDSRYWTWPSVRAQPWLAHHNLRAAGDGMAWPNLTLVSEGNITRAVWVPDRDRTLGPVRFVSVGEAWARSEEVTEGLAKLVDHVLDRLAEAGLPKTRLSEEWTEIATRTTKKANSAALSHGWAWTRTRSMTGLRPRCSTSPSAFLTSWWGTSSTTPTRGMFVAPEHGRCGLSTPRRQPRPRPRTRFSHCMKPRRRTLLAFR